MYRSTHVPANRLNLGSNVVTRKRRVFLVLDELITYYFGGTRITIATASTITT